MVGYCHCTARAISHNGYVHPASRLPPLTTCRLSIEPMKSEMSGQPFGTHWLNLLIVMNGLPQQNIQQDARNDHGAQAGKIGKKSLTGEDQ